MSANHEQAQQPDDVMMVDHHDESVSSAAPSNRATGSGPLFSSAAPAHAAAAPDAPSTLALRPAPAAPASAAAPAAAPPAGFYYPTIETIDNLPDMNEIMPVKPYRTRIFQLAEEQDASALAYVSTTAQSAEARHIFAAAGIVRLSYENMVNHEEVKEIAEDVTSYHGYVEALRHHQKKKNLMVKGLVKLIAEHGTPELQAGLKNMLVEVRAEEEKLDELWKIRKQGMKFADLDDDVL
ncbi:67fa195c-1216-4acd-b0da-f001bb587fcb [Thermothielavioides terrestris]|uniref:67fa195c-1216-4acd-b0da-f001bb587fcb n=1 Tax=Thermothielavioides terrestris TaxID=2587410 RepID=A0A3S4CA72_9PEZI|nr:67fa195c-1216-4acd-b0da-f001bb587fcb [Thermothielavioides terrestris]